MWTNAATMEVSMVVPQRTKIRAGGVAQAVEQPA
jgi:hypothetical protein